MKCTSHREFFGCCPSSPRRVPANLDTGRRSREGDAPRTRKTLSFLSGGGRRFQTSPLHLTYPSPAIGTTGENGVYEQDDVRTCPAAALTSHIRWIVIAKEEKSKTGKTNARKLVYPPIDKTKKLIFSCSSTRIALKSGVVTAHRPAAVQNNSTNLKSGQQQPRTARARRRVVALQPRCASTRVVAATTDSSQQDWGKGVGKKKRVRGRDCDRRVCVRCCIETNTPATCKFMLHKFHRRDAPGGTQKQATTAKKNYVVERSRKGVAASVLRDQPRFGGRAGVLEAMGSASVSDSVST